MAGSKKNLFKKKRAAGIEPASSAWKAEVLPLNYARITRTTPKAGNLGTWQRLARLDHYGLPRAPAFEFPRRAGQR